MTFLGRSRFRDRLRSVGGESFALDGVSAANFAYALFPLSSAFVGQPVARVRDVASGVEAHILGSVDANISDASNILIQPGNTPSTLGAWRTGGGSLAVRTLFQQGAVSGVNLEQTTATSQPLIMSSGSYITIGGNGKVTMQSIGSTGLSASLGTGNVITQAQASADAQSSTFITAQRINSAGTSSSRIYRWYGDDFSLYLAFSGTDYYLDMPATLARINGTWANKDVAAIVTAWRSGANMALLRGASTIGSTSSASSSVGAGPLYLQVFPSDSTDYFSACFISWPSKISNADITTVGTRLALWT